MKGIAREKYTPAQESITPKEAQPKRSISPSAPARDVFEAPKKQRVPPDAGARGTLQFLKEQFPKMTKAEEKKLLSQIEADPKQWAARVSQLKERSESIPLSDMSREVMRAGMERHGKIRGSLAKTKDNSDRSGRVREKLAGVAKGWEELGSKRTDKDMKKLAKSQLELTEANAKMDKVDDMMGELESLTKADPKTEE